MTRWLWVGIPLVAAVGAAMGRPAGAAHPSYRISLERVARFPSPGSRIPGSFHFTHDGRHLYYLAIEGAAGSASPVKG